MKRGIFDRNVKSDSDKYWANTYPRSCSIDISNIREGCILREIHSIFLVIAVANRGSCTESIAPLSYYILPYENIARRAGRLSSWHTLAYRKQYSTMKPLELVRFFCLFLAQMEGEYISYGRSVSLCSILLYVGIAEATPEASSQVLKIL